MGMMASQITSLTIVYSTLYWGSNQRTHQSSASLAFVRGIHRWPVNSPHKWPVTRKTFPIDDTIMIDAAILSDGGYHLHMDIIYTIALSSLGQIWPVLKTKSSHDANFVLTGPKDNKVAIIKTLVFQWYWLNGEILTLKLIRMSSSQSSLPTTSNDHFDGLVQEIRNSTALAMELRFSCTKPLIEDFSATINFYATLCNTMFYSPINFLSWSWITSLRHG